MVKACVRNQEDEDERHYRMKPVMESTANGGSRFYWRV